MQLTEGKTEPTGYYLNEFGVPAKALVDAGYTLVLATPKGNAPAVDSKSVIPQYFGGDSAYMEQIQRFVASIDGTYGCRFDMIRGIEIWFSRA